MSVLIILNSIKECGVLFVRPIKKLLNLQIIHVLSDRQIGGCFVT